MKNLYFSTVNKTMRTLRIGLLVLLGFLLICCSRGSAKESAPSYETGGESVESPQYDVQFEETGFISPGAQSAEPNAARAAAADANAARADTVNSLNNATDSGRQRDLAEDIGNIQTRKLIKQAELSIEADKSLIDSEGKLSGVNQKVDELIMKYRGYSEKTWSDEDSARFTIRVPEIHYESLIAGAGTLGKIRSRSETAEDVTIKYYDLEGRLNTRKTLLATFQGYISRAKDIDDIMKIETRIADLQNEIDRMGSQLTLLANMVDYSTVELYISTPRRTSSYTLGERIESIFKSFGGFASGALLVLLSIAVYGIPIILFCLIVYWIFFGRLGLLKKAFRFAKGSNNIKKQKQQTLMDVIKDKPKNDNGSSVQ